MAGIRAPRISPGRRFLATPGASRGPRRGGGRVVQLFKHGRHTVEYRFLKKDGSYCWVNDEQRLIRDEEGQPIEVIGSWSDVTERKQAEEAAAAARDRVEHLLAQSPAVIYSYKATGDYAPTFISQTSRTCLGYDREEYLESADFWRSRVHPEDGRAS